MQILSQQLDKIELVANLPFLCLSDDGVVSSQFRTWLPHISTNISSYGYIPTLPHLNATFLPAHATISLYARSDSDEVSRAAKAAELPRTVVRCVDRFYSQLFRVNLNYSVTFPPSGRGTAGAVHYHSNNLSLQRNVSLVDAEPPYPIPIPTLAPSHRHLRSQYPAALGATSEELKVKVDSPAPPESGCFALPFPSLLSPVHLIFRVCTRRYRSKAIHSQQTSASDFVAEFKGVRGAMDTGGKSLVKYEVNVGTSV
ncbi:hypothetical protein BDP27DRAFT_1410606 [Rhodocollybia butyracea]|uniref:Uncharacterized protein n=1 Tax=Rhodocollybia butyracea TaxID=206335 RepID=A0A9P5TWR7_9AGAR|nr:hypothetical protein BDP27DRAFT_1410606 [Rhodocollybia butyracea]